MSTVAKSTYQNYQPAGVETGIFPLVEGSRVLEIGFGSGQLLKGLRDRKNDVYGTDVGQDIVNRAQAAGFENVVLLDSSEEDLPYQKDFFDAVFCYEVFEHLTNPYRMVSEVSRVLKPGAHFYFSVPTQEGTMGYASNRHSFVYPGLLEKENLERFFMQMYFKVEECVEDDKKLIAHRHYRFKNMKRMELPDIMEVIVGDYRVQDLYGHFLDSEQVHEEILKELRPYLKIMDLCLYENNLAEAQNIQNYILNFFRAFSPLYFELFEILSRHGYCETALNVLKQAEQDLPLSPDQKEKLEALVSRISKVDRVSAPLVAVD